MKKTDDEFQLELNAEFELEIEIEPEVLERWLMMLISILEFLLSHTRRVKEQELLTKN